jgi:hypothetical protein
MDAFEAVSIEPPEPPAGKKYFTVAEANRSLSLVRRIAEDIVNDIKQLRELHTYCQGDSEKIPTVDQEDARRRYASLTDHLAGLNEELDKIGCECRDYRHGVVDFPAWVNGREICLNWRLGESCVACWHELDAGYSDRRPITEIEQSYPVGGVPAD